MIAFLSKLNFEVVMSALSVRTATANAQSFPVAVFPMQQQSQALQKTATATPQPLQVPMAQALLDTEAQLQEELGEAAAKIAQLTTKAAEAGRADAARIAELEKALALSESLQKATVIAHGQQLKALTERIESLTGMVTGLLGEVKALKAREQAVEGAFVGFCEVYNGHKHTEHDLHQHFSTSTPGTSAPDFWPRMSSWTSHEFPVPRFAEEGKKEK
jgi:hypothetical protein